MKKLCPYSLSFLCAINILFAGFSQSPVGAFTASYISTSGSINNYTNTPAANSGSFNSCVTTNYNYTFNNGTANAWRLLNITANATNYFIASNPATIRIRRVNNPVISGTRSIIFLESVTAPSANCPSTNRFDFKSSYQDVMEVFLDNYFLNQGTDNIFTNRNNGDGNNNNIERVDVLFSGGLSASNTNNAGFALFDRGVNNAHDGFRIAAITALDGSGNPSAFGPLVTCVQGNGANNGSWGHPTMANGNSNLSVYVLRKEAAEPLLKSSAAVNQQVGGVFFTYADLGVSPTQVIYGYALFGPDGIANPTNAQLLNLSDASVYPTNTTENAGGGLDLIAVNAAFITGGPFLPVTLKSFTGTATQAGVLLNWEFATASDGTNIELQRSNDKYNFSTIQTFIANDTTKKRSYIDKTLEGDAFYRLAYTTGANLVYSNIVFIKWSAAKEVQLYPTRLPPGGALNIAGIKHGKYRLRMYGANGQSSEQTITATDNRTQATISPTLKRGTYFVQVTDEKGAASKPAPIIIQ